MFDSGKNDCNFCGHHIMKEDGSNHGHENREWKKCHEEERCFEKTFECRERKITECREKSRC